MVLVRFEDWEGSKNKTELTLEQTLRDFDNALKTATTRSPIPYLVCVCPPSPTHDTAFNSLHDKLQEQLDRDLQNISSIYLIKSQDLTNIYPVEDYYDPYGEELGNIPYTLAFFAALGTILVRKILALINSPYKVIVLDCDNTLWHGFCGEDGVKGVKIDAPFRGEPQFKEIILNSNTFDSQNFTPNLRHLGFNRGTRCEKSRS